MLRALKLILVGVWMALCVVLIVSYAQHTFESPGGELDICFWLQMVALTFPLGYVAGVVVWFLWSVVDTLLFNPGIFFGSLWPGLSQVIGERIFGDYGFISLWLIMTAAGCYQWFVWLPKHTIRFIKWAKLKQDRL